MYDEIPDYRYRLVDSVGEGFVVGTSFGSAFHFIRGLCSSPRGGRLAGGVHAVRTNLPRVNGVFAGRLAVTFWALDSGMALARRRRDDHWNSIVAGTGTLGIVNLHRGGPAAARGALLGATLFVVLAGADLSFDSWHSRLVRSGREVRIKDGLPALVPISRATPCRAALGDAADGSVEHRSENDARLDLFAMEQASEMTPKNV